MKKIGKILLLLLSINSIKMRVVALPSDYVNEQVNEVSKDTQQITEPDNISIIAFSGGVITYQQNDEAIFNINSIFMKVLSNTKKLRVTAMPVNAHLSSPIQNTALNFDSVLNEAHQQHINKIITGQVTFSTERKMIKRCGCYEGDRVDSIMVDNDQTHANKVVIKIHYTIIDVLTGEVISTERILVNGEGNNTYSAYDSAIKKIEAELAESFQTKDSINTLVQN